MKKLFGWRLMSVVVLMAFVLMYFSLSATGGHVLRVNTKDLSSVPVEVDGHTYVSINAISKAMGDTVQVYQDGKRVTVTTKSNKKIQVTAGQNTATVGNKAVALKTTKKGTTTVTVDAKAYLIKGELHVPVEFIYAQNGFAYAGKITKEGTKTVVNVGKMKAPVTAKKVMWGKTELVVGQIGKVTILANTDLVKLNADGSLTKVRTLKKGEQYRVYNYKGQHNGLYGVGASSYVQKNTAKVKYETPSKAKLDELAKANGSGTTPTPSTSTGKTYPDGWTAPVLKSKWKNDVDYNKSVLKNELGFRDGWLYDIKSQPSVIVVGFVNEDYDVKISHSGWLSDMITQSYRVPIVTKELLEFYFEKDAQKVFNYYEKGNFPNDAIILNKRTVKFSTSEADGKLIMEVGYPNKPF